MNRNEIESDPHALIEGMAIGAYITGATDGVIYIRAEYPLAVHQLTLAIGQAREYGLLGKDILGRGFSFDIEVVEGAGAFVCGEETALIASLEGRAGRPRPRPPFPAEKGLWGYPTNINNVETWFNIAPIIALGPAWFAETGAGGSSGTKVFSLVGKVRNTGLVEMPLGTPLGTIVHAIGGGSLHGHPVKAVQTGGPSGGCIPPDLFETPVDYESLGKLGAIMGSGGMVVMDEDNCMVDVARYFIQFTRSESCGKCTPCRVGLDQALRILTRITKGKGREEDLADLDELGRMIRETSLCGLGQTAPNSLLTTLRHFHDEFEDHIHARRCRAGVCQDLVLSPCENSCPLHMNIPRFLELYREGRLNDAFLSVIMDNPLPASTGRVCQHPCDNRCRRLTVDDAVNMREVHRLIADKVLLTDEFEAVAEDIAARRLPPTGRKVAVAGGGPAGLTAAFYLALLGHAVTVFEDHAEPGGMLRYALPEYRLPKAVLDREIEIIRRLGVEFVFNTRVGEDVSLNELDAGFDAVFLSIGTWKESWVYLPGTELAGVRPALPFLEGVATGETMPVGHHVAVIGGGNAAIDSARTAVRLGASATVIYRRERKDMPAIEEEVDAAEQEGVRFQFLAAPHRIVGDHGEVRGVEVVKTRLGEFDPSGRRRPILTNEVRMIRCSSVILAVGEAVDRDFCAASGLSLKESGVLDINRYSLATSREKFYAGGDLVTGASNISNAMGYGKDAARHIDARLTGKARFDDVLPRFDYGKRPPDPDPCRRHRGRDLPAASRRRTFAEATEGLTPEEAAREASRCLRCDIRETVHH
jgi:NADH-quinone oxidoreductase subunit F